MKKAKPGYRLFKHYVRFLQDRLMFRKHYVQGAENLPHPGEPFVIPANHQNAAIDPLILLLSIDNISHPYVLAMGGVFTWSPLINKFWDWLGMLPAFRMSEEGVDEAATRARWVIDFAASKMEGGEPVIIFPEQKHHIEHWMRVWQIGYLNIAFKAAEKLEWKQDVRIVPAAHHYSSYFGLRQDYLIRYGEPVSLQPYYEQYQSKPRTTMRELNKVLRERVARMMLYTEDVEHEPVLEFVRHTTFAAKYTKEQGFNAAVLPEQLDADQQLWNAIEKGGAANPEAYARMTELVSEISAEEKRLHVAPHAAEEKTASPLATGFAILAQLLLLPVWLFALIPDGIMFYVPPMFMPDKDKDTYNLVFTQSMQFILSAVLLVPIFSLIALLVLGLNWCWWWQAAVWILSWFPLGIFAWYEGEWMRKTKDRLILLCRPATHLRLRKLYSELYQTLQQLVG